MCIFDGIALCSVDYPTSAREFQGFRAWGKFVFWTLELTDTPTDLANQVKVGHALNQSHSVQSRGPERAHQTVSSHGDRRGQIAGFRDSFEKINWLYLFFKSGIKIKTHFEWLLWHQSSLGQLNFEPTRPLQSANWPREDQCQRSHAHGFLLWYFTATNWIAWWPGPIFNVKTVLSCMWIPIIR